MKNRFSGGKKNSDRRSLIITVCIFAAVFFAFWFGISSVSTKADTEEIQTLEQALVRGITYCYATEGSYPESLADLKENYGFFYDEEKYFIDYQPLGSNIMPDFTVIRKKDH
ncbi:MAG: hypothetical protein HFG80_14630 [Eubacterium sp.]|nr:hypothetical protein [Eubacterium sp.]